MATLDDLLAQLPIDKIAGILGVDPGAARDATKTALPALVQGMQANAKDAAGAASLSKAIAGHAKAAKTGAAPQPDDVDNVDTADGDKIVGHVFGDNKDAVVNTLGGLGGGSDLIKKLLPILAPLVMAFLGKQVLGKQSQAASTSSADDGETSGGIGGLLKDTLGGLFGEKDSSKSAAKADEGGEGEGGEGEGGLGDLLGGALGGGGLGDLLGGVLGGGSGSSGGGGLGDLLGGLLGGGRK